MRKYLSILLIIIALILNNACNKDEEIQPELEVEFSITNVSSHNGNDGAIDITITGGEAPYSISWSTGDKTEDLTNLSAGLYTVTVEDSKLIQIIKDTVVTHPFEEGTVNDYEGNIYKTIKIGDQWWMAENLNSTLDKDGNPIANTVYKDVSIYGRLYTWNEALKSAPEGWHLPDYEEWVTLFDYLGGIKVASGKMKQAGLEHWNSPNYRASNSSEFNAIGAGESEFGKLQFYKKIAIFWPTTEGTNTSEAIYFYLMYDDERVYTLSFSKNMSYYIRCIKD